MDQLSHTFSKLRQRVNAAIGTSYQSALRPVRGISSRWPSAWLSTWSLGRLPLLRDPESMESMPSTPWKDRRAYAAEQLAHCLWICGTYLSSELIIWGLSRMLAPVSIEFFSSIMSMLLVFTLMTATYLVWRPMDGIYQRWIKPRVDFINAHMGVGFPVPIVMLNEDDILNGRDIARIMGNAVVTNIVSWTFVLVISYLLWSCYLRMSVVPNYDTASRCRPRPLISHAPRIEVTWYTETESDRPTEGTIYKSSHSGTSTPNGTATGCASPHDNSSAVCQSPQRFRETGGWRSFKVVWPIVLALLCIFLIGAPVTATMHDSRLLDFFVLWFLWISALTMQGVFKSSPNLHRHPRPKVIATTLMNPVLLTTLLMIAYTRLRVVTIRRETLDSVLGQFSAGTPLYTLWTAQVRNAPIASNPDGWFGAGDAALSLLECGIFVWGFKLFECRRQLFSAAGSLTILVSVIAAVGNVFLSVLAGRAMGLGKPEALAFAARSVTLALAKPAIEAVGGNMVVNAALVVGNGILGQLMYPFALDALGVKAEDTSDPEEAFSPGGELRGHQQEKTLRSLKSDYQAVRLGHDDAITVAAGIAIGVNGAAMGVAYLYETKSRAAPYAALSMTVFGVTTVVLTTVGPFKVLVMHLAGA